MLVTKYASTETRWIRKAWFKRVNTPLDSLVADPFAQSFTHCVPVYMATNFVLNTTPIGNLARSVSGRVALACVLGVPLAVAGQRYSEQAQQKLNRRIKHFSDHYWHNALTDSDKHKTSTVHVGLGTIQRRSSVGSF